MRKLSLIKTFFVLTAIFTLNSFATAQSVTVKGKVLDKNSGDILMYATVGAKDSKTSEFVGTVSDLNGDFSVTLKPGNYTLTISYAGYKDYVKSDLNIIANGKAIDLGKIFLTQDSKILDGITIEDKKEDMRLEVDKKVFNVENSPMTIGGDATDVLNQIPTVDVDMDGNISLRGSSDVQIYINGKPSNFSGDDKQAILKQIPAANIERIEVINNPSAKYDAEGTAGIINIILKSSTKPGWNAMTTVGYGTFDKYNASASFSYGKRKVRFNATYGFRDHNSLSKGYTKTLNMLPDTTYYLVQNRESGRGNLSHTFNGNVDYDVTKRSTVSLTWLGSLSTRNNPQDVFYSFDNVLNDPLYEYDRTGLDKQDGNNGEIGLNWTSFFDDAKKHSLIIMTNLSASTNVRNAQYKQDESGAFRQNQNTRRTTDNFMPMAQLDYTRPLKGNGVLESGMKFTMRKIGNDFYADTLNYSSEANILDSSLTNNFLYSEIVNAAYVTYTDDFGWIKVKAGIRAEQSIIEGIQKVGNQSFSKNYTNLFPSIFLTREIKKGQDFQVSYSRRINRPWIHALNPFADQTDPYSLRRGNPDLNPEMIDAYEATYFVADKGNYISGTAYYRQVNGVFQRYREVNNEGVATMTTTNLDVSRNVGLEGIIRRKFKDLNATLNLNLFRNQVAGNLLNNTADVVNYSWFGKLLLNYSITKGIDASATYFYRGKVTHVQGTMQPMHSLDLGLKMDVLKKHGTLSLNFTDIFNTRQFSILSSGGNFDSESTWKWQSRVLTLNFTYKMGDLNPDWNKRNKRRMEGGDSGGGEDLDF